MVARTIAKKQEPIEDRVKPVPQAATGTATVVIGCKLPNGIMLRQFRMVKKTRNIGGHYFEEEMAEDTGRRFTVRGPAVPFAQIPNIQIVGGYALTPGVPQDLAEIWFEQNKDADCVVNQLMFWEIDVDRAAARARELNAVRSGLEPVDPSKTIPGLGKVTKADLSDRDMGLANS
jgi:hypothetical protein